jgi:hypothetical protein
MHALVLFSSKARPIERDRGFRQRYHMHALVLFSSNARPIEKERGFR